MNGRHTTELRQVVRDALQRRAEAARQVNRSNGRLVRMAVGVAAGGIVLAIVLMLTGCVATPDYEAQERAREQARQLAPLDTALAAVWRLIPLGAVLGVLGLGLRMGLAAARRYETERTPSADGTLPIKASQLDTIAPAALASAHITRAAAASRPGVPHSIHYAPRTDTRTTRIPPPTTAPPSPRRRNTTPLEPPSVQLILRFMAVTFRCCFSRYVLFLAAKKWKFYI
jgi:hypothetical protein